MIILNERKYVESMITNMEERYYNKSELTMLIKFLVQNDMDKEEVVEYVNDFMTKTNEDYIPEKYIDFIERTYKKIIKNEYKLSEIDSLYLTNKEVKIITSLKSKREQRFLATIILIARMNILNNSTNTIFQSLPTVLEIANVTVSKNAQDDMLASFERAGLIESDKEDYDNLRFKVICLEDGDNEFGITDMKDVGKQFDKFIKLNYKGYKECSECGEAYKPKNKDSRSCMCRGCHDKKRKEDVAKNVQKYRENAKK